MVERNNIQLSDAEIIEFCKGCDKAITRYCWINETEVQEYYIRRGLCFDAEQNNQKGIMYKEGFKPD